MKKLGITAVASTMLLLTSVEAAGETVLETAEQPPPNHPSELSGSDASRPARRRQRPKSISRARLAIRCRMPSSNQSPMCSLRRGSSDWSSLPRVKHCTGSIAAKMPRG